MTTLGCATGRHDSAAHSGYAEVNGTRLWYESAGHGEPIVLLHGGFMDAGMWDDQVPALSKEFRVVRYDMRGFGRSAKASEPHSQTDDLAALLDHLRIQKAHIVGLSMGGGLAIDFALDYPARVRSLIVAEPGLHGHRWSEEVVGTMRAVSETLAREGRARAIETFLERPVFATARNKPAAFQKIRKQLEANFSMEKKNILVSKQTAIERLHQINAPTLVILSSLGGPDSRVIAETIRQKVPNVSMATIADSGHMMNLEQPEEFTRLVRDFAKKH